MTDGTTTYGQYVEDELAAQSARKASLEQRAVTVITSSGALATLLFGLAALSTTRDATFALPQSAGDLLVVSLGCFVVAATFALAANIPLRYQAVRPASIRGRLNESPVRSVTSASRDVALTRLNVLESAKIATR